MSEQKLQSQTVQTTGHAWDGDLQEYNNPLPVWWVYTFYATVIFSIVYWVVYPSWPFGKGWLGGVADITYVNSDGETKTHSWNTRALLMEKLNAASAEQKPYFDKVASMSYEQIAKDPEMNGFIQSAGRALFSDNCAPCHGRGAAGGKGYPNLNDDEWIWGGKVEQVHETILYGIRSTEKKTRDSAMPKFGIDKLLDEKQINDAAEYVLSLSGKAGDKAAADRGAKLFTEQCASCHGEKGQGNQELGAPSLTDAIWLYGSDKKDVFESIWTGRGGMMPAWTGRLDPVTVKSLAVYVHSLGGGK